MFFFFLKLPGSHLQKQGSDCIHARVLDPNSGLYKWLPESISASENGAHQMADLPFCQTSQKLRWIIISHLERAALKTCSHLWACRRGRQTEVCGVGFSCKSRCSEETMALIWPWVLMDSSRNYENNEPVKRKPVSSSYNCLSYQAQFWLGHLF